MHSFTRQVRPAAPAVALPRGPSRDLRHRRSATVGLIATLLILAGAIPAQATVIQRERFNDPISEDFEFCGIAVHEEGQVSGFQQFRVGKGKVESAFFELAHYHWATTVTNTENGNFFTLDNHAVVHDVKATRVEGTIFEFTSLEAGQPFVLRDMSGNVVLRDRGVIRTTLLFDTLGDATPGGEVVEGSFVDDVRGPHPGFSMGDEAFCAIVQDLLG